MKIAVFIGSLRKDSFNRKLYDEYKVLSKNSGLHFEEMKISNFPYFDEDVEKSHFPEVVTTVANELKDYRGVLFFSPEYNYSIPGVLKNALDWLSRVKPSPLAKKPAAILGASQGKIGTARMQYEFRKMAVTLDMMMLNKPEVMVGEVQKIFDGNGKLTDEKTKEVLTKHIEAFQALIKTSL